MTKLKPSRALGERFYYRYAIELVVLLLTAVTVALDALFGTRELTILIGVVGVLLAATSITLRREIAESLASDVDRIVWRIYPRWRDAASQRVRLLTEELEDWADGRRALGQGERINYQVSLLEGARSEVLAIHDGTDVTKLQLWLDHSTGFGKLVDAQTSLKSSVRKQRVLVVPASAVEVTDAGRRLTSQSAIAVCAKQVSIGFEVNVYVNGDGDTPPRDVLIVDGEEAVLVDVGNVSTDYDASAIVSPARVNDLRSRFETIWNQSYSSEALLAPATTGPPATVPEETR